MLSPLAPWIDEDGRKVEIKPFFSRLYTDSEVDLLNRNYDWMNYAPKQVGSSLGSGHSEHLVIKLLSLAHIHRGWCGVAKNELQAFLSMYSEQYELDGLIKHDYLRVKKVAGVIVVFPTEKLLKNQNVPENELIKRT